MLKTSAIRQAFFDYFTAKDHQLVPSSSLVPENDPTLLFTNAGMVQFKETFLGLESRPYTRAVSAQRCVRAGGKHNDLDNVGYTARHHTFFEMLGNFSFGDYFKREAITYAWEFLTTVLKLPPERLWVTVYENDEEAADIWLNEIGVSKTRFSRCGEKDNFWSMGDTGPCGPCTEIFYDHGPDIPGGPPGSEEADLDRYIEIWNVVFMEFDRDKAGQLHPLPKKSVDTGMGLERIAAVVQGVHTNYEIDSFQQLIQAVARLSPQTPHSHPSLNVIADHLRACSFLVTDGVLPSNEGRGYVLRRIIRRAVRHGHKLNILSPFFAKLVPALVAVMGEAYPVLRAQQVRIERILTQEEEQFSRTLAQGMRLLDDQLQGLSSSVIPGEIAFKLYDTYGFPVDLTEDVAREQGLSVDKPAFDACMQQQRLQSQASSAFQADYDKTAALTVTSTFQGYEQDVLESTVLMIQIDGQSTKVIKAGSKAAIILQETPFYAESGGQAGDHGLLIGKEAVFRVDDTKKVEEAIVHHGELISGVLSDTEIVRAEIDVARRAAIRLNHTATHLLHEALKRTVGSHVQQKGSLVEASRARFDFSHDRALTTKQCQDVECLVNERIRANDEVVTTQMSITEAEQSGAVALFGEKYGDRVRVLSVSQFSKELCGGTHARRTGDLGLFKILSESGIANGVRRIEFVTGQAALQQVQADALQLESVATLLKARTEELPGKITQLLAEVTRQGKELTHRKQWAAIQAGQTLCLEVQTLHDIQWLVKQVGAVDPEDLRTMMDQLKSNLTRAVVVLVGVTQDKINVMASVSKVLLKGSFPTAVTLVQLLCGKGGGRPDAAQGGSVLPTDLQERLAKIEELITLSPVVSK